VVGVDLKLAARNRYHALALILMKASRLAAGFDM
jgi:hypothetical protein